MRRFTPHQISKSTCSSHPQPTKYNGLSTEGRLGLGVHWQAEARDRTHTTTSRPLLEPEGAGCLLRWCKVSSFPVVRIPGWEPISSPCNLCCFIASPACEFTADCTCIPVKFILHAGVYFPPSPTPTLAPTPALRTTATRYLPRTGTTVSSHSLPHCAWSCQILRSSSARALYTLEQLRSLTVLSHIVRGGCSRPFPGFPIFSIVCILSLHLSNSLDSRCASPSWCQHLPTRSSTPNREALPPGEGDRRALPPHSVGNRHVLGGVYHY